VANSGVVSAFTADRLQSKGNGSNYYPYGESKTSTAGDDREGFATYTRDEKSGLDYADQRWYASGVGRFSSPDPYQASAGPSDPASWNRFTYVRGEPIGRYDPTGLADCVPTQPCSITVTDQAPPPPAIPSGPGGVNAPSLMLPPPGEGAPTVPMLDFFTQDGITFIGHTTNTETDREIKSRLTALVPNLDSDCEKWLSDGLHNLSADSSLSGFVQQILPGVGSAYRIYKDNDPGSVINATQGAGNAGNITINATGAYYFNKVNLGEGTNGIKSGSERAKTLLLIHELAHIVLAAGFLPDRDNAAAGASNNLLLRKNCDKTLSKYKN